MKKFEEIKFEANEFIQGNYLKAGIVAWNGYYIEELDMDYFCSDLNYYFLFFFFDGVIYKSVLLKEIS